MRTLVAADEPSERPPATGSILTGPFHVVGGTGGCTAPWLWPQTLPTTAATVVRLHWQPTN